jgi:hypothetical protein
MPAPLSGAGVAHPEQQVLGAQRHAGQVDGQA